MSYVLNLTGSPIAKGMGYATVSGADGNACLFRVNDMMAYLERVFGRPDKIVKSPRPDDFAGMKDIIVVKGSGWRNARGHVTLWDGARCPDTCYVMADPEKGRFIPEAGSLWVLQ
ncbi:hypothetical protein BLA24064_06275 [Burkholderia latens]|uniref:Cytoplasmic protein n=2 Tax=Burkholderia latens TaxID=488446 RepID=A0A6P2R9W5_9BURK|nr:hypothetical protein BLA24064_06275 [Burkholderia latens]